MVRKRWRKFIHILLRVEQPLSNPKSETTFLLLAQKTHWLPTHWLPHWLPMGRGGLDTNYIEE